MEPKIVGVRILEGSSDRILAQKYALTEYMLLLASLKKTGRSSGKMRMTFWIALKLMLMVMKKRAPFLF